VVLGCAPVAINSYGVMQLKTVSQGLWPQNCGPLGRPPQYANYVGRDQ